MEVKEEGITFSDTFYSFLHVPEDMDPPVVTTVEDKFGHFFCKVPFLNPRLNFQWNLDNISSAEETNQTLIARKKGNYSCTVSNDYSKTTSLDIKFRK